MLFLCLWGWGEEVRRTGQVVGGACLPHLTPAPRPSQPDSPVECYNMSIILWVKLWLLPFNNLSFDDDLKRKSFSKCNRLFVEGHREHQTLCKKVQMCPGRDYG
jgi:hypothetical protein